MAVTSAPVSESFYCLLQLLHSTVKDFDFSGLLNSQTLMKTNELLVKMFADKKV